MEYIESFLIGLLQGVTEFLPISSSGHIVVLQAILGHDLEQGFTMNIVTHFATLFSIIIYFHKDLRDLVISFFEMLKAPIRSFKDWDNDETLRFNTYVLASMLPAGIAGFTIRHQLDTVFANPLGVSMMFIFTGLLLFATKFYGMGEKKMTLKNTFLIGCAQAIALIPGVSRSGITIAAGVFLNMNRNDIARFTFIMMLPVVAGATLVEALDMTSSDFTSEIYIQLIIGFTAALISGYYSLKYLIILFKSKGIHYFAYYCWAIGVLGLYYFWPV